MTLSVSRLKSDAVETIQKERSWPDGGTISACAWTDWEPRKHCDSRRIGPDSKTETSLSPPNKASHLSYRDRCFHYCFVCQPLPIAFYSLAQLCFKYTSLHPGLHKSRAPRRRGYHILCSGPDRLWILSFELPLCHHPDSWNFKVPLGFWNACAHPNASIIEKCASFNYHRNYTTAATDSVVK